MDSTSVPRRPLGNSHAKDGRFELYKTPMQYDAEVGRGQHGFLMPGELDR